MSEKTEETLLPHHVQQNLCTTRLPYRQGRKLTAVKDRTRHYIRFDKPQILAKEQRYLPRMIPEAIEIKKHPNFNREDGWVLPPAWDPVINIVKSKDKHSTAKPQDTVYTINNESKHLLVFGVPSLNLRQETKALFLKFGKLLQFNLTDHQSEQFTETYHALYEHIAAARLAKRMLDTKNFYGGSLHVCYAPELETIEDTREKMLLRKRNVIARLRNLQKEVKEVVLENKTVVIDDKCPDSSIVNNKIYMGDVNNINIGNNTVPKKRKLEKSFKPYKNDTKKEMKLNNSDTKLNKDNIIDSKKEESKSSNVEIIDFTSAETETLSNINEALNYNSFGRETIRQIPYKPLNKIKFNLNKKT